MVQVSIGLPVYNGERYISETIESILRQTFTDFELIICDNASKDDTGRICKEFARQDSRIRYYRNSQNIGAGPNFNRTFHLSSGKYFKWAAHDDLCAPEYLQECVKVLERFPSVVLCHSDVQWIDADGNFMCNYDPNLDEVDSPFPSRRFRSLILSTHWCIDIFGLMRRDVLSMTPLIASYIASDRSLLVELALRGSFYRIPQVLFFSRDHPERSIRTFTLHERGKWWDPSLAQRIPLPNFRLLIEYVRSIHRVSLPIKDRFGCYMALLPWISLFRGHLRADMKIALKTMINRRLKSVAS